jgi:hypothetical protein
VQTALLSLKAHFRCILLSASVCVALSLFVQLALQIGQGFDHLPKSQSILVRQHPDKAVNLIDWDLGFCRHVEVFIKCLDVNVEALVVLALQILADKYKPGW